MLVDATQYSALVGDAHRKAFGQFFTPPAVARFMVDWALASGAQSLHDPAFGLGAFLDAAAHHNGVLFSGSERDPEILRYFRSTAVGCSAGIREEDYLLSWGRRVDAIVCNPPYMRFQRFRDRKIILSQFEERLRFRLSGYTNSASAFLVKSLSELRPGGRLAYLMPLEFLNTGYGAEVKERLIAGRHSLTFIRLDCEKDVFPDVITSVGILLLDSSRSADAVRFFSVQTLQELPSALASTPVSSIPYADLRPDGKWHVHFRPRRVRVDRKKTVSIRHFGHFSRGIATGANEFFVLRRSRVRELGLLQSEITLCITKSRQVQTAFLTDGDLDLLAERDEPIFFFRPGPRISPQAASYIAEGERHDFHERFLLRHRRPWHKSEVRQPAPLLVGVFSRGNYKVVRNLTQALNLTCFHGFVPSLLSWRYIDRLFLYLASSTGRAVVSASSRQYGDALTKYEPHDLNGALAPKPEILEAIGNDEVAEALHELRAGNGPSSSIEARFQELLT